MTPELRIRFVVLKRTAGSGSGGPGPLEIETTEMAGDIDDFADEEEAWNETGFHGFTGELVGVDASRGYFGFFVAFGGSGDDGPSMKLLFERGEGGIAVPRRSMEFEPALGQAIG